MSTFQLRRQVSFVIGCWVAIGIVATLWTGVSRRAPAQVGVSLTEDRDNDDDDGGGSSECDSNVDCADGNRCTRDRCRGGRCVHHARHDGTVCSDGLFCNGLETCQAGSCVDGPDPCTNPQLCREGDDDDHDDDDDDGDHDDDDDDDDRDDNDDDDDDGYCLECVTDADCKGLDIVACDDCNLNGIPDACDIAAETSLDVSPADGIPDECSQFGGGCVDNLNWTCIGNWNLPGDLYPDNTGAMSYNVTLDQSDVVFLDTNITIDSLRIVDSAMLRVTQTGPAGDLNIVAGGGLLLEGGLSVANDRMITVPNGAVILRGAGQYGKEQSPFDEWVSAALSSDRVEILAGGRLRLEDSMSLFIANDLRLECTSGCTLRGGQTPPVLQNANTGAMSILGDAIFSGSVVWGYSSSAPLELAGDFVNHCISPGGFDFVHGTLLLNGTATQLFEVAGDDLGALRAGFNHPVAMHSNFAMGAVDVAAGLGREVIFENAFANIEEAGPCEEALYVHQLILRNGSHITLNNCRVYYETLTDQGATVTTAGCGQLSAIPPCTQNIECDDGSACYHDECISGVCQFTRVAYGDVNASGGAGAIDLDDILCVLDGFASPTACINADVFPCRPNGLLDLDDILAVLDAFAGADPCDCN